MSNETSQVQNVVDFFKGFAAQQMAYVATFQAEEARLLGVRRGVGLVEEALRGRRFVARL